VFPYTNGVGDLIMATGKNHSIKHTPGDVARYCDAINVSCEAPEEAHKDWVKKQGVCTNQGPEAQLSMMLHTLRKEASSLLCEAVQGNVSNFYFYFILVYCGILTLFLYILHMYVLQLELRMVTKSTTGLLLITGQETVCPSEQTAGTKVLPNKIKKCQVAIMEAFESTFGTEPRFDASLLTLLLVVVVTTGVTMR